ncbi:MAG: MerR family transcriptional regulator [Actinobacteria bacterium]|nr:MerR family transcriptional regulator [Actinomycetota bacterium]
MTDPFLRIGPFSRASSISIKALRAYHEQGLLVPAAIDPATGYRVYAADQLLDAAVLRRLRELDVPLRRIRVVLEARDPMVTAHVLAEHTRMMQQRLDDTIRIIHQLQRGVDEPALHTPVHVRDEPARHALMIDGRLEAGNFVTFLSEAFERLRWVATRAGATVDDVPGGLYAAEIADDVEDTTAYLPIESPVVVPAGTGVRLGELPATTIAVAVHLGGYDELAETYRHLGRWVAANASLRPMPVRERYVIGAPAPEAEWSTEIQWPVEATPTTHPENTEQP